ncbi:MAG: hypothetical protein ACC707_07000 [Thiohalomonadales bacterium]
MIKPIISVVGALFLTLTMFETQADVVMVSSAQVGTSYKVAGNDTYWTRIVISGGVASGGGIPQRSFTTTKDNELITVTFTAACNVESSVYSVLFVRFKVDGNVMLPNSSPLCIGRGLVGFGIGKDVNTAQAFMTIPNKGKHWYEVEAKLSNHNGPHTNTDGQAGIGQNTSVIRN